MNRSIRGGSRRAADERGLQHVGLTEKIIGVFFEVYNELGHGFLESVYEAAMVLALRQAGGRWSNRDRFL